MILATLVIHLQEHQRRCLGKLLGANLSFEFGPLCGVPNHLLQLCSMWCVPKVRFGKVWGRFW